jgi:sugar/nucleoside kinase (ribokinase family)
LKPEDVIKQKKLFRKGEIFLTQLELSPETIETAIIQAKESGLVTIVDAGPQEKSQVRSFLILMCFRRMRQRQNF